MSQGSTETDKDTDKVRDRYTETFTDKATDTVTNKNTDTVTDRDTAGSQLLSKTFDIFDILIFHY